MTRTSYVVGLGMLLIGGYMFLESMVMVFTGSMLDSWMVWTIYLTLGIILVSIGPGVIVWAYTKQYQESYALLTNQTRWQSIQIPMTCSSCGNEIAIHSLEWIGPNEARCPYCSNEIEVRHSLF
jgi:DNA-directed RNA polymerase subunit RPC12/RpoP